MALMSAEPLQAVVNGEPVRYFKAGTGPPLVLLHGLGGTAVVWYRNLPGLAERYTVLAPDLWGPDRYRRTGRFTPVTGIRFLTGFLDALGHEAAHLVGSSLGGLVAGFTALQHPMRARSLTLVASAGLGREIALSQRLLSLPVVGEVAFRPSANGIRRMLRLLLSGKAEVGDPLVDELLRARLVPGVADQMLAVLRSGVNVFGVKRSVQLVPHLGALAIPALIVWGTHDPLFPIHQALRAAGAIPNATLRLIEGAGHWSYVEDPDGFNQSLLTFLERVEDSSPAFS